MIRYIALKNRGLDRERQLCVDAGEGYDICACDAEGDVMEVLAVARDAVPDRACAETLIKLLNSDEVDPIHMEDIIEDQLYEMTL